MMTWFKNFALPDHWISAVLTVMTLSLLSGYGLASTRPVIHVTFEFELLPPYDDQIGPERRTKLSTCIVNRFIAKAERKWGFVQWSSSASSEKSPSWQLKLKLDGPRLASGRGWVTSLIQSRSLTGRNFEPFELLEYQDVYALNNQDFSYHDWKTLERDISDQLDKQLQGLLKDDQVKDFMGKIPIAHKVIAEKENQGLVIPFRFKDLRASNKTSLRITFINPENGKQGTIDLVPEELGNGGLPMQEYITGLVTLFSGRGLEKVENEYWDSQFEVVFKEQSVENAESLIAQGANIQNGVVSVNHYSPEGIQVSAGATDDGSVRDPIMSVTEGDLQCSAIDQ